MNKLNDSFSKLEILFSQILGGAFAVNGVVLLALYFLQGEVSMLVLFVVMITGIYHIIFFFVFIARTIIYYQAVNKSDFEIKRSIAGIILSPIGLLFSFFNYLIIVLSNIW